MRSRSEEFLDELGMMKDYLSKRDQYILRDVPSKDRLIDMIENIQDAIMQMEEFNEES